MPSRRSRPKQSGGPALEPVPIPAWYKEDITQSSEGQKSEGQKSEGQKSEGQESAEGQKSAEGQESATRQT